MSRQKLILINGFAGAGKSTIARMYIDEHPLALMIEGDELIVNIGDWLRNESEARPLVYDMIKAMLRAYLPSGHDVVLPYLVSDAAHVEEFEAIAREFGAEFHEFLLHNDRQDAVARLLKRGTWGEAGLPPLGDKDIPEIEKLMDKMESELQKRPDVTTVRLGDNPTETYTQLKTHLR